MNDEKETGFCDETYDERLFEDNYSGCTVCAQCGYRFAKYDDAIRVNCTGDVIHKDCWMEYSDDNIDQLSSAVSL